MPRSIRFHMLRRVALVVIAFIPVDHFRARRVAARATRSARAAIAARIPGGGNRVGCDEGAVDPWCFRRRRATRPNELFRRGPDSRNVELDAPASAATVYRIGSITKQFTAAAVMRLVDAGKLALDDPIEKFLPEFPVGDRRITMPASAEPHVRHQELHQPRSEVLGHQPSRLSARQLLALFKDEPPDFQPARSFFTTTRATTCSA